MKDTSLPKVLAISLSTWREDSGIHTQTDLFRFWDKNRVAQIYLKSDLPNTDVCERFFQISENAVIHSVINRHPVGREVQNGGAADAKAVAAEQQLYAKAHKKKSWFLTVIRELVWACGKWKTPALDAFVKDFDADVYFVPIYPVVYTAKIQQYILKRFPKPYVCYLADDNYSYRPCGKNPWALLHRFLLRKAVRKLACGCDEMFTITRMQAEETDRLFGTHSVVLTKGIDYSRLTFEEPAPQTPLRMVYTGNLLIGRASSLVLLANAIRALNRDALRVTLDVYTPTPLDEKTAAVLNADGCTLHPPVPKEQVAALQKGADVVVFVESLEPKHRQAARLSFSTKLTDYFASGKCIFAIGGDDIAPIAYLAENDAACIATGASAVAARVAGLVDNPALVCAYARRAFDCGRRNHEQSAVKKAFISTIQNACRKD